ncbi:MAG: hypothetical protein AAFX58_07265, partial [Pseudomonadota bacterium]
MEKYLFKKIEMWVLLLVVVLGFAALILFGATVRHVAVGGKKAGALGDAAFAVASIPSDFKDLLDGPNDFIAFDAPASAFDLNRYEQIAVQADE